MSQNNEILARSSSFKASSFLTTIISGWIPKPRNSLTDCCVGLVFISPAALMYGNNVQWIKHTLSRPKSLRIWRIASKNGKDSISPVVPPISVITTSASLDSPASNTRDLISFVTWGITWTVPPK